MTYRVFPVALSLALGALSPAFPVASTTSGAAVALFLGFKEPRQLAQADQRRRRHAFEYASRPRKTAPLSRPTRLMLASDRSS
jgi:hypothetical protein